MSRVVGDRHILHIIDYVDGQEAETHDYIATKAYSGDPDFDVFDAMQLLSQMAEHLRK